ncbi:MAG: helical backbone metal receptor [Betaproteobacteria bacterium]
MRIASLVPSLTELLFALDLDNEVVARTGFCIHPRDQVRRIPKVGGTKDVDINALLATRPTHLIANIDENRKETIAALRPHIPEVVVTHPLVPDDNLALYREFGRLFGRERKAAELASQYAAARLELDLATHEVKTLRVLYLIWKDPWFTVGRSTYVSSMLACARLETLPDATAPRYPILEPNDPAWAEADIILLSSEPYAFRQKHADQLTDSLRVPKPVALVDGEMLSWYGNRAIAGLHYLKKLRAELDAARRSST